MRPAIGLAIVLVCSTVVATEPTQRTLTFDERVNAQRAIERVYYGHQLGATKEFHAAVPAAVIEAKVYKYLDESAALTAYWKTAVTDQMLQRELERMAQGTRMPERLQELYAALGNDPFRIKECLARPVLVDRLTHNFYAFDATLHVKERGQADALHARLASGELRPSADYPNRSVSELGVGANDGPAPRSDVTSPQPLTPEEFRKRRAEYPSRVGDVSDVKETREAFTISVVLSETATHLRVASYVVPKTTWDAWWSGAHAKVRGDAVVAVASGSRDVPGHHDVHPRSTSTTCVDDYWDNGSLNNVVPEGRTQHLTVWTGTHMIIWGGNLGGLTHFQTGGRYDPATDTWAPTSLTGAPDLRIDATAVWTGHEMVVWGGRLYEGSQELLSSGGRYDPVSDTWSPTSGRGAPTPRFSHSSIWTGSRMVIWGGTIMNATYTRYVATNTGAQYDPITDSWTPTTTIHAPSPRSGHTAIWTGSLMVIWGGSNFYSGGRYDPVLDRWTPTSTENVPDPRTAHSAVWTGSEMIVWGGWYFSPLNTGGRYNPTTDTWVATSTLGAPIARAGHTAVWTGDSMVVWGSGFGQGYFDTGGRYDPATDNWLPTSRVGAPEPREFHGTVWTGSLMLIWGGDGQGPSPSRPRYLNSGGRYDPTTDSWTPTDTTMGVGGTGQTGVWTGNLMLVWLDGSGERYDPVSDSRTVMSNIDAPSPRYGHSAVWTGSRMVIWGGIDHVFGWFNTGGLYDPVADRWSATSITGAPSGRTGHTAVWTGSSMVIWGGYFFDFGDATYHDLDTGGRYDPASDTWAPTSETGAPSARRAHTAVWTGNAMVVWGGGVTNYSGRVGAKVNTGGAYDPAADTWVPTSTTNAPSARADHTAIWTGSLMIVWGGTEESLAGTGGRYDPATDLWSPTSTISAPFSRFAHSAIWTGTLMVVWGGYSPPSEFYYYPTATGGRYDPAADGWSPTSLTGQPGMRAYHSAAWTGNAMLVVGGEAFLGYSGGGRYVPGTVMDNDCDRDGITGYTGDCDDHNAAVYPGAPQICDGFNNDCNDPYWPTLPHANNDVDGDYDGDGFLGCRDDCDDTKPAIYPGAPQRCDGINNDCGDPAWPAVPAIEADADHDGARVCDGDCDDNDAYVGPGNHEICDGRDNDCNGIADDAQAAASCDDGNPCTDDVCGGVAGCRHTNNHNPCDDYNSCTSSDVCGGGICAGTPTPGASCDDRNDCTTEAYCNAYGRCDGISPCDDGNPCTRDFLDPDHGCTCAHALNYDVPCDDGDACTTGESCHQIDLDVYACAAWDQPTDCSDDNPCTDDMCDPSSGCFHTPRDGAACSDGNPCTQADTCLGDACVASIPTDCSATCPAGSTPTAGGCSLTYDIDDNALDNLNSTCGYDYPAVDRYNDCVRAYGFHWTDAGRAIGPVIRVDVAFEPGMRCSNGPSSVSLNGSVIGTFVPGGTCTCSASNAPVHLTAPSVDSYATSGMNQIYVSSRSGCEGLSATENLGGHFARVTVTYQRKGAACAIATCDLAAGGCSYVDRPDGTTCSDGEPCTIEDACSSGLCRGAPVDGPFCDDGSVCTLGDRCVVGACLGTSSLNCDDGNACNGSERCDGLSGCVPGVPRDCDDQVACTVDSCNPATGCVHIPNVGACDDLKVCTTDTCDPATGCAHTNNTGACEDGNPCTTNDICGGGTCHAGQALVCNDNNGCTTDSCVPATGCVFENNANACEDGNICTVGDTCGFGTCHAGAPWVCLPSDQCHLAGTCDPASGMCSNAAKPDGAACEDGNPCTTLETCGGGVCNPGVQNACNDDNLCTADTCSALTTWTPQFPVASPPARDRASMAYDPRAGQVVLFGGVNGNNAWFGDTWTWDRTTWTQRFPASSPPRRFFASMTYDPRVGQVVLFGGSGINSVLLRDTWTWNGATWTQKSPATSPSARFEASMAYDAATGQMVLFGGLVGGSTFLGDTWTWDGNNNWNHLFPSRSPPVRFGASMAYDPATGQLVLFGGIGSGFATLGDTWTWDGTTWTQRFPANSPSPRYWASMAYDTATGQLVLFGPPGVGDMVADTWTWNGSTWTHQFPPSSPPARQTTSMVYDSGGGQLVLFGGRGSDANFLGDTWTYGYRFPPACVYTPAPGTTCTDGNACTTGDTCTGNGSCVGTVAAACDDNNMCTTDTCTPASGCLYSNNTNDCDDHNPCTVGDRCGGGTCNSGMGTPNCDDNNPCTDDSCDSYFGCLHSDNQEACDDGNACTAGDLCGEAACHPGTGIVCNDKNVCTTDTCSPATGCLYTPTPGVACSDGSSCTMNDTCTTIGTCAGGALANCDDGNPCTDDVCNPATGCVHLKNSTSCNDGNACTTSDVCAGGTCHAGSAVTCNDNNSCTTDSCSPATGCVFTNNTIACSDGNACTTGDTCGGGTCHPGTPVVCQALDQCHAAGICTATTGTCSNPLKANGTTCDDGSLCTRDDACQNGTCTSAFSGLNHPHPRSSGYYHQLCEKAEHQQTPYHGDQITDADAVCVAGITPTFSDLSTVADICGVIDDDGHHGGRHHGGDGGPGTKECDKAENELIATALNICRARVCEAQNADSRCGVDEHHVIETTVAASFSDANTILDDPNRTKDTCQHARCELKEINSGHALEMNSLLVTRAPGGVRLSWLAMDLEDGTGMPNKYEVWRRPLNASSSFTKLGETTTALTFVDGTAGTGMWEYEVTADIP